MTSDKNSKSLISNYSLILDDDLSIINPHNETAPDLNLCQIHEQNEKYMKNPMRLYYRLWL